MKISIYYNNINTTTNQAFDKTNEDCLVLKVKNKQIRRKPKFSADLFLLLIFEVVPDLPQGQIRRGIILCDSTMPLIHC